MDDYSDYLFIKIYKRDYSDKNTIAVI